MCAEASTGVWNRNGASPRRTEARFGRSRPSGTDGRAAGSRAPPVRTGSLRLRIVIQVLDQPADGIAHRCEPCRIRDLEVAAKLLGDDRQVLAQLLQFLRGEPVIPGGRIVQVAADGACEIA